MRLHLRRMCKLILVLIGVAFLLYGISYIYFYYQEKPESASLLTAKTDLPKNTRLLVFAPHCDDEVLGCAGMIHDVIRSGGQVRVVIMTNGDGFTFAAKGQFHRLFLKSADYVQSGYIRQKESLQALRLLGVPESQVLFLGFPDRGLTAIWNEHWENDKPFKSRYTDSDHSPYLNSYQRNVPYSGQAVLTGIEKILTEFQPTLIIAPHPGDQHYDHSATWAFVMTAVAKLSSGGILPWTTFYTYLIHRGDFPIPHGYQPESALLPPKPLTKTGFLNWHTYPLDSDAKKLKEQSIQEYKSQLRVPIMSKLLKSFVRTNELFEEVYPPFVEKAAPNMDLSQIGAWEFLRPVLVNPLGVNPLGALESKARLMAVSSCVQGDSLWLRFHIPAFADRSKQYQVSMIEFFLRENQLQRKKQLIQFSILDTNVPISDIIRSRDDVIIRLPITQQGLPDFFFIQVQTRDRVAAVDRTVWQPAFIRCPSRSKTPIF